MSFPFPEPRAAYIHVPFCAHRCGYCDFTLVAGKDHLIDAYLSALDRELSTLGERREVDTLFFGGGTPTHLSTEQLWQLFQIVARWISTTPGAEISVEANPHGLNTDKVAVLAEAGVNRISLGVQSFDERILKQLERDHTPAQAEESVECVRARIDNVSIDLIFGVPGQSLETWRKSLSRAIRLEPAHVSTYGLTYERGTAFWSRRVKGQLASLPEETERAMYALAMDELAAAGIEQYELSNFARAGFLCRHNEVYWQALPYFGFGPGAARYIAGRRETNHRSTTTWLKRIEAGESPVGDAEELSPEDRAREAIVLGLRRRAGIDRAQFRERTGFDLDALARPTIDKHVRFGSLEESATHVRLTSAGCFVADSVIVDFL